MEPCAAFAKNSIRLDANRSQQRSNLQVIRSCRSSRFRFVIQRPTKLGFQSKYLRNERFRRRLPSGLQLHENCLPRPCCCRSPRRRTHDSCADSVASRACWYLRQELDQKSKLFREVQNRLDLELILLGRKRPIAEVSERRPNRRKRTSPLGGPAAYLHRRFLGSAQGC